MKILAIVGSYRKGKTIDTLVDKAIEGVKASDSKAEVQKTNLIDKHIEYCRNCMTCRWDDPNKNIARCVIPDDMQAICSAMDEADGFIFGTPVNMGAATAIMKVFLERICWVMAKPRIRLIKGIPEPRTTRMKKAIIIVSSGLIPPLFRRWCDDATPLIKGICRDHLNAKVVGTLYAGAVEKRGVAAYFQKANDLGRRLSFVRGRTR